MRPEQIPYGVKVFKSLYYYYGIVTMGAVRRRRLYFRVPNECVRRQIFEYMHVDGKAGCARATDAQKPSPTKE